MLLVGKDGIDGMDCVRFVMKVVIGSERLE